MNDPKLAEIARAVMESAEKLREYLCPDDKNLGDGVSMTPRPEIGGPLNYHDLSEGERLMIANIMNSCMNYRRDHNEWPSVIIMSKHDGPARFEYLGGIKVIYTWNASPGNTPEVY